MEDPASDGAAVSSVEAGVDSAAAGASAAGAAGVEAAAGVDDSTAGVVEAAEVEAAAGTGLGLDTITTRKSFSLMLSPPTVASSLRILPGILETANKGARRTRVDKFLVLGGEGLRLLDLLLEVGDLLRQCPLEWIHNKTHRFGVVGLDCEQLGRQHTARTCEPTLFCTVLNVIRIMDVWLGGNATLCCVVQLPSGSFAMMCVSVSF